MLARPDAAEHAEALFVVEARTLTLVAVEVLPNQREILSPSSRGFVLLDMRVFSSS